MVKLKFILLLCFAASQFLSKTVYSQNTCNLEIKTAKYKKKYLPIVLVISNNSKEEISILIPPSIGISSKSKNTRYYGWNAFIKKSNGEIERKGYERIKPSRVTKKIKLNTKLGVFLIRSHRFDESLSKVITLSPGEKVEEKVLIQFRKSLHKGLKNGENYLVEVSYNSGEYINQYPKNKGTDFTRDIKLEAEINFKK